MINTTYTSSTITTSSIKDGSSTSSASNVDEGADRFLTLLVAQMKNQDPLNPMDNAQVTSQMAQINTVKGIEQLNTSLQSLLANFKQEQPLQAASLIGRSVLAPGSNLLLNQSVGHAGAVLPQSVDNLKVTIVDDKNIPINTVDLGPQKAGLVRFAWDGKTDSGTVAPDGTYKFTLTASADGKTITVDPMTIGMVTGITSGDTGTNVTLAGLGEFGYSKIKQIY